MERIRIFHGSTTYLSDGFGSYHSRSVVMGGANTVFAPKRLVIPCTSMAAMAPVASG